MKTFFGLTVFIIIAIIAWWSVSEKTRQDKTLQGTTNQPYLQAFINNFKLTSIDISGKADYTLTGSRLERYNNSANATISQPIFNFLQPGKQWKITADTAIINQENTLINLQDDVVMQQKNTPQAIKVTSQHMQINTRKQITSTSSPVQITQGLSTIHSTGMIFYNRKHILELNSNVNGYYVTNPSPKNKTHQK